MCVKPRKSNVSGFPRPRRLGSGGEPSELDQPCLVGLQLQAELRESLAKVGEEPLGVTVLLEPHEEVIGVAHDDHVAVRVPTSPLLGPQVEDVVQVDVGEQRRNRCPLRRSRPRLRPLPVLDNSCSQPFRISRRTRLVRDTVLEELHQPRRDQA